MQFFFFINNAQNLLRKFPGVSYGCGYPPDAQFKRMILYKGNYILNVFLSRTRRDEISLKDMFWKHFKENVADARKGPGRDTRAI